MEREIDSLKLLSLQVQVEMMFFLIGLIGQVVVITAVDLNPSNPQKDTSELSEEIH